MSFFMLLAQSHRLQLLQWIRVVFDETLANECGCQACGLSCNVTCYAVAHIAAATFRSKLVGTSACSYQLKKGYSNTAERKIQ